MLKTAVVKFDLKEPVEKLLEMVEFIRHFGTEQLHIINVQHSRDSKNKDDQKLESLLEGSRNLGFSCQLHSLPGEPAGAVLKLAKEVEADFISLYWVSTGVIRRALLGSVDANILWRTNVPVFVFKKRRYLEKKKQLNSVLYATDFQATDRKVLPYLCNKDFQAKSIYLLHVGERAPDPYSEKERQDTVMQNLDRLASRCESSYQKIEKIQVIGWAKRRILFQAWSKDVDLIVLGRSDKAKPFEQILGSTAEAVAHKSKRNSFIIP